MEPKLDLIIYKTTNLINGKIYIGQDSHNNPEYLGSGKILRQAIKKYGKENFKKEMLEKCNSIEELSLRERYWIQYFGCVNRKIGYNLSIGGGRGNRERRTWQFKKRVSNKLKGRISPTKGRRKTKEEIEKQIVNRRKNAELRGFWITEQTRKKLSLSRMGKIPWNKGKKGMQICWNKGRKRPDDVKRKISESVKKYYFMHPEAIRQMSLSRRGRKQTIETIEKRRLKLIGKKRSKDYCQKWSGEGNPFYGKHHTEETKRKLSLSHKGKKYKKRRKMEKNING